MESKELIQFANTYVKDKLSLLGVMFLERRENVVIFNINPTGFLIVKENIDSYRVIGYSVNNKFAPNPIVDSIIFDSDILACRKERDQEVKNQFEPIVPLIKTQWDQYGHSLPKMGMVAGCVPTGLAQLIYYHKHPLKGKKSTQTYTYHTSANEEIIIPTIDLPNVNYRWDDMPEIINEHTSIESLEFVADLMYHIGAAMKTKFDYFETGVSMAAIKGTLHKYFGYDIEDLLFTHSNTVNETLTKKKLIALIYDSLHKKRPFFIAGGKSSSAGEGHLFLGAGIDRDGLIYFNFGWGGAGDGYYDIFDTGYASQIMLGLNYKPAEPDYLSLIDFSISQSEFHYGENVNIDAVFKNCNFRNFHGKIGLGININKYDDVITYSPAVFDVLSTGHIEEIATGSEIKITLSGVIPNDYKFGEVILFFMSKNEYDNTEWRYVDRTPLKIIHRRQKTHERYTLSSPINVEEFVHPGWQGSASFEISNHSDKRISGALILCFVDDFDNVLHKVSIPLQISLDKGKSEEITITMFIQLMTEIDRYHLRILFIDDDNPSESSWKILASSENNDNEKNINVCNIIRKSSSAKILKSLDMPNSGVRGETTFTSILTLKNTSDDILINPNGLIRLILLDEINKTHAFIDNNGTIALPPKIESLLEVEFKVPDNIEIGKYMLALQLDDMLTETENHEIYVFSPADGGVISQKSFSVLPDTVARFVKLTKDLVTPEVISLGSRFDLSLACRLTKSNYFVGFIRIMIKNLHGDVFELGATEMISININQDSLFTINCIAQKNVLPGDYFLFVVGHEYDDAKNLAVLTGLTEIISDCAAIIIKP